MAAVALGAFFKSVSAARFKTMGGFVDNGSSAALSAGLLEFCQARSDLRESLLEIVPKENHDGVGLLDGAWPEKYRAWTALLGDGISAHLQDVSDLEKTKARMVKEENY